MITTNLEKLKTSLRNYLQFEGKYGDEAYFDPDDAKDILDILNLLKNDPREPKHKFAEYYLSIEYDF